MDEAYPGTDSIFQRSGIIEKSRKHSGRQRKLLLGAAGAVAIVGLTSLAYFSAFSAEDAPAPVAAARVETPEKVAALVIPAPRKVKVTVERIEPRAARLDAATPPPATEPAQPPLTMLSQNNPRWARAGAASSGTEGAPQDATPEPLKTAELRSKLEKLHSDPGEAKIAHASSTLEAEPATDSTFTGTIPPRDGEQPQPATIPASAGEADESAPEGSQIAAEEARTVQVTTHVNMRAGPENEAAVLTVLPAGTDVKLIGCDMWCEVDFDGRRGWVYKSFIAGS